MSGKGSKRRPQQVSNKQADDNWDNTFGIKPIPIKVLPLQVLDSKGRDMMANDYTSLPDAESMAERFIL